MRAEDPKYHVFPDEKLCKKSRILTTSMTVVEVGLILSRDFTIRVTFFYLLLVPGAPADIKASANSEDSVIVSWLAPAQRNGKIKHYTVYNRPQRYTL